MELYFKEYRDRDFFDTCERIRREAGVYMSVSAIARKAVLCEAQSFYLSEQAYVKTYYKSRLMPECRNVVKTEMYREIRHRFLREKRKNPERNFFQIARIIAGQKAPRFYMSEGRAIQLYYELLKKPG